MIEIAPDLHRPGGPRYGALVHAVLATVALDADRRQIGESAALQGRILGATEAEMASAAEVVGRVLASDLLARARASHEKGLCRRETPVTVRLADGTLVEGVVDLAFLEGTTWIVVDFKTDRELESRLEDYRKQVALYRDAISRATGQEAQAFLVRV